MRRALAIGFAAAVAACGIFNDIVLPSDAGPDVIDAQQVDAGADAAVASYLTVAEAAKFCSLVNGCPGTVYLPISVEVSFALPIAPTGVKSQFSMCMHWLTEVVQADRFGFAAQQGALKTIAGATCGNINALMPILVDKLPPAACGQADAGAAVCASDGAGVVFCEGIAAGTAPCRQPLYGGAACTAVGGTFSCVGGPCTHAPSCEAGVASYCSNDSRQGAINCALWGRDCVLQAGVARCETGTACTTWQCAGTTLQPCGTGTTGPPFTCPSGTTCMALSQGGGFCAAAGASCTPDRGGDRCDGDTLHYCAGGHDETFNCASINWFCRAGADGPVSCYPTKF